MAKSYLFKSERLGFRTWLEVDFEPFSKLNSDPEVMKFFPWLVSPEDTQIFMDKMNAQFARRSYCYFAVDLIESEEFIGFIGFSYQEFESDFTPSTDIGWRLDSKFWKKGYAGEGAKRCLDYAFEELELKAVYSHAPKGNIPSIEVMKKIGMHYIKDFHHPKLEKYPELNVCVLYHLKNPRF